MFSLCLPVVQSFIFYPPKLQFVTHSLPTSVKIRGKNAFYLRVYVSLLLKTKNNRKNSNKQDQRGGGGGFVAWVHKQTSSWYE